MTRELSRRQLIQSVPVALALGLAGCSTDVEEEEVRVVGRQPAELKEPVTGSIDVEVLVHNIGVASDVEITVEAVDIDEDVVATNSIVEPFERDEQRTVSVELTPSPKADIIFAEAAIV
ncbi:hypothetical protein [Halobacteriaceae bacterium SHR40]|uniref:hypothetical protein n=1 Tax=Halovenus amylolytica TaxID=2500550 RepID=UPI000FE3E0A6